MVSLPSSSLNIKQLKKGEKAHQREEQGIQLGKRGDATGIRRGSDDRHSVVHRGQKIDGQEDYDQPPDQIFDGVATH